LPAADARGLAGRVNIIFTFRGKSSDGTLSELHTFSASELCESVKQASEASEEPAAPSGSHAFAKDSGGSCSSKGSGSVDAHLTGSSAHSGRHSSAKERDDNQTIHDYGDSKFTDPFVFISEGSGISVPANPARVLPEKTRKAMSTEGTSTVARAIFLPRLN